MPRREGVGSSPRTPKRPSRSLKQRAIAYLARRDYARAELRERLVRGRTGEPADVAAVEALLDELTALGYLSESRYAQSLVSRKAGSHGRRAIEQELAARGVAPEAVHAALEHLPQDDSAVLRTTWERRFGQPPADEREKARQVRFLQSRGFRLSEILKLLREVGANRP